jgi:hypothetical protein
MSPMQQIFLGMGAVAKKIYMDDLFSTYLYEGNNSTLAINNGLDLATEGGMIWVKNRDRARDNCIVDTERGIGKRLETNKIDAQDVYVTTKNISSFTSTGFTLGVDEGHDEFNRNEDDYASWSFRKAPGFFDIISWDGNQTGSSTRTLSHSLGSIPGMVMIKRTDGASNWWVYHRSLPDSKILYLQETNAQDNGGYQYYQSVSSTGLTVGTELNESGRSYVAYIFAGGESTAATARSVYFDGSGGDRLQSANSSNYNFGSGNFTIEGWFKLQQTGMRGLAANWSSNSNNRQSWRLFTEDAANGELEFWTSTNGSSVTKTLSGGKLKVGQWTHFAVVRSSNTLSLYLDGTLVDSASFTGTFYNNTVDPLQIGGGYDPGANDYTWKGDISNFRIVKGTAVYTSAFKPPTEPLTSISGTSILCCNNSSITGSTTTSGTITQEGTGSPTASTDSPFDDPAGFVFGENGDQNVIKAGSWEGTGTVGLEVNVGFEPQWVLFKNASATYNWYVLDVMRGLVSGGDDRILTANGDSQEWDSSYIEVTPTGFKIETSHPLANGSGNTYIYMCLRRPDGYVGKPPELGTDVFNMVMGTSNSDVPAFVSGFVTDFAFNRGSAITEDWWTQSRLTGDKYLRANTTAAQGTSTPNKWDYNNGWYAATSNQSAYQSWMWKRHAGFDVVTFEGTNVAGLQIQHNLGKTPEMIWIKNRDASENWSVYHKGLNGGSNQGHFAINLNHNYAEIDTDGYWNDTAPTATAFTVGNNGAANGNEMSMLAMLFASVSGISAVGSYTGNGNSTSGITVTTGFQLRFLIIKRADGTGPWYVVDSLRGMSNSGDEKLLKLNTSDPQVSDNIGNTSSTGFTITSTHDTLNGNGDKYIYYAHA